MLLRKKNSVGTDGTREACLKDIANHLDQIHRREICAGPAHGMHTIPTIDAPIGSVQSKSGTHWRSMSGRCHLVGRGSCVISHWHRCRRRSGNGSTKVPMDATRTDSGWYIAIDKVTKQRDGWESMETKGCIRRSKPPWALGGAEFNCREGGYAKGAINDSYLIPKNMCRTRQDNAMIVLSILRADGRED